MTRPNPDLFQFFRGNWRLTRTVLDGAQRTVAQASGVAGFVAGSGAGELLFEERGQLLLTTSVNGRPIPFTRRYRYVLRDDLVDVFFADGTDNGKSYQSYRWSPSRQALLPCAEHTCIADCYSSQYRLADGDHFEMQTTIQGPHKSQVLQTIFARMP